MNTNDNQDDQTKQERREEQLRKGDYNYSQSFIHNSFSQISDEELPELEILKFEKDEELQLKAKFFDGKSQSSISVRSISPNISFE